MCKKTMILHHREIFVDDLEMLIEAIKDDPHVHVLIEAWLTETDPVPEPDGYYEAMRHITKQRVKL